MTDQPFIDLTADVLAVLDTDHPRLVAEQTALNAELTALLVQVADIRAQIAANQQSLDDEARFRALAASIQDGSVAGQVVVPAAPPQAPSTATPLTPGITTGA